MDTWKHRSDTGHKQHNGLHSADNLSTVDFESRTHGKSIFIDMFVAVTNGFIIESSAGTVVVGPPCTRLIAGVPCAVWTQPSLGCHHGKRIICRVTMSVQNNALDFTVLFLTTV